MNDLPAKLDEIGAHYSACDRQQTIYAAAREIESLTAENEWLRKACESAILAFESDDPHQVISYNMYRLMRKALTHD